MAIDDMRNYGFEGDAFDEAHGEVELKTMHHQKHKNYKAIADVDIEESVRQKIFEEEII